LRRFVRELYAENAPLWYALGVAPKHERIASDQLAEKGIEPFAPVYTERRRWLDRTQNPPCYRTKPLERPLFPRYIFARFDYNDRVPVLSTCGVIEVIKFGPVPIAIPDHEIESIRAAIAIGADLMPIPYVGLGDRVEIVHGSMTGYKGIVKRIKGEDMLVLSVEMLGRSVAVSMDRDWVQKAA
jgi:transcriptional antiterminator RfaH